MKKSLAFVLGGGGSRGAMQVGALRALLEAGFKPDLLVGTSIGAVNAVGLALWGMNMSGVERLERAYENLTASRLMDPRLAQFILDTLSRRPNRRTSRAVEQFLIAEGITTDLCFGHPPVRLGLVSSDLESGEVVIYGRDPEQSILEGLMASLALPLWFAPVEKDGRTLIDGGALSNLPIESALALGATEIIALDLNDRGVLAGDGNGYGSSLEKFLFAITRRQVYLEMELASARHVPLRYVNLKSSPSIPIWDFRTHQDLFKTGYETMQENISSWSRDQGQNWFLRMLPRGIKLPRLAAGIFAKK
ncbi:MAG TPA: patatin-like phospholipase family protein [Anaerolineales bacterium]|nr:patatin-like phospholipase family protein [Anaerolineales bacterium]